MATDTITGALSAKDTLGVEHIIFPQTNISAVQGLQTELDKIIKAISTSGGTITFTKNDGTTLTATIGTATTSADGLLSKTDKSKLDGIATGANNYSLPTASASTLGGVKVGTNLSISNGVLSASVPTATSSVLGGVKTGSNITNSSGTISLTKENVTAALGFTPSSISGGVSGVKGNYESSYRTGNVNLTSENIHEVKFSGVTYKELGDTDDVAVTLSSSSDVQFQVLGEIDTDKFGHVEDGYKKRIKLRLPSGAGYNYVPAGGAANKILAWSAAGTAKWDDLLNQPFFDTYISTSTNLNEMRTPGLYRFASGVATNLPSVSEGWTSAGSGRFIQTLIVLGHKEGHSGVQILVSGKNGSSTSASKKVFWRAIWGNDCENWWHEWGTSTTYDVA